VEESVGRGGEREKRRKKNSRISFSVVYIQNVDLRLNQIKGIFFFSLSFLTFSTPARGGKVE
jgi:hypothetical protein